MSNTALTKQATFRILTKKGEATITQIEELSRRRESLPAKRKELDRYGRTVQHFYFATYEEAESAQKSYWDGRVID